MTINKMKADKHLSINPELCRKAKEKDANKNILLSDLVASFIIEGLRQHGTYKPKSTETKKKLVSKKRKTVNLR